MKEEEERDGGNLNWRREGREKVREVREMEMAWDGDGFNHIGYGLG